MKKLVGVSLLAFSLSFASGTNYGTLGNIPLSKPLMTTVNPPNLLSIHVPQRLNFYFNTCAQRTSFGTQVSLC